MWKPSHNISPLLNNDYFNNYDTNNHHHSNILCIMNLGLFKFFKWTVVSSPFWTVTSQGFLWQLISKKTEATWIARFMGPTWGPSGADRTQVGPMLAQWTLLSGHGFQNSTCWGLVAFKWAREHMVNVGSSKGFLLVQGWSLPEPLLIVIN